MSKDTTRLKLEREKVRKLEKRSHFISVKTFGNAEAPEKYVVTYNCVGVTGIDPAGNPTTAQEHDLQIDLTEFPERIPKMVFLTDVFHPGVEENTRRVALERAAVPWGEPGCVAKAIVHVGEMLQYRLYNEWLTHPANPKAAFWFRNQKHIGPGRTLDRAPLTGGEASGAGSVPVEPDARASGEPPTSRKGEPAEHEPAPARPAPEAGGAGEPEADPDETLGVGVPMEAVGAGKAAEAEAVALPAPAAVAATTAAEAKPPAAVAKDGTEAKTAAAEAKGAAAAAAGAGDTATGANNATTSGEHKQSSRVKFGSLTPDKDLVPFPVPRLLHWKPTGKVYEVEKPPFMLVVTSEVLATVNAHVRGDLKNELGGFLLGNRCICPEKKIEYIRIDNSPEARFTSNGPVSIELFDETFQHLVDERDGKYKGKVVIGWYHSHPDYGAFLSPRDVAVHTNRLPQPWNVALVIDPLRGEGGFFCWRNGKLHPYALVDFYELRGVRAPATATYMPWTNYECFDAESGEERQPHLAEGAGLPVVVRGGSGASRLFKDYGVWAAVALVLLAVVGIWRAGWFNPSVVITPPAVNGNVQQAKSGTTPAASAEVSASPQPSAPAAPPPDASLALDNVRTECPREDFRCLLIADFKTAPKRLQVEMDGRLISAKPQGRTVTIDISNTDAMSYLRRQNTTSTLLNINFTDAGTGAKLPYSRSLSKADVAPRLSTAVVKESTAQKDNETKDKRDSRKRTTVRDDDRGDRRANNRNRRPTGNDCAVDPTRCD